MLDYAKYEDVVDILSKSNHDSSYQELMGKEQNVLDTVNAVVKNYRDRHINNKEFINRSIMENISRFWMDMNLMIKELLDIVSFNDVPKILSKGERIIYFGCICIFLAVIFFFLEISK